jgi:hypothetical protein
MSARPPRDFLGVLAQQHQFGGIEAHQQASMGS